MTKNDNQQADDVKQSFAWGQLFVGSILAGFSVYQLALKAMSVPPSDMLAGFVATYEAVRDFLMIPFSWMHLDLTAIEKNLLVICGVLVGALVRASGPRAPSPYLTAIGFVLLLATDYTFGADSPLKKMGPDVASWIACLTAALLLVAIALPLNLSLGFRHLKPHRDYPRGSFAPFVLWSRFVLLNILFTVGWGTVLLLLNWATS
jgi:hypothetical protein